jgi:hypothetical protein
MRHLIHALEGCGNYIEAERSLDAYLLIIDNEKKSLLRRHTANGQDSDSGEIVQGVDSNEDILRTMIKGVRILVKGRNKGKRALEVAQRIEHDIQERNIKDPHVLGAAWHAIGMANSLWSMQSKVPRKAFSWK